MFMKEREERFFNLPKSDRVQYLMKCGFNVPELLKVIENRKELVIFFMDNKSLKFSIRSQRSFEASELGPHFPNATLDETLFKELLKVIKNKWELLIYVPIDPKLAEKRGNLWIDRINRQCTLEYALGPGTVRDLEKEDPRNIRSVKTPFEDWIKKQKAEDYLFLGVPPSRIFGLPFESYILEFSVYKVPVGMRKQMGIFWEIRRGG